MAALVKRAGQPDPGATPKATPPATQFGHPHCSSGASRRQPLQSVFVMESAQAGIGHDLVTEFKPDRNVFPWQAHQEKPPWKEKNCARRIQELYVAQPDLR